ncbi:MAG: hypothetical protein HY897_24615 [Deltaproteobacteria bacterium]|nr:hypothetical protein [Deltaproteobacteria bacterium]
MKATAFVGVTFCLAALACGEGVTENRADAPAGRDAGGGRDEETRDEGTTDAGAQDASEPSDRSDTSDRSDLSDVGGFDASDASDLSDRSDPSDVATPQDAGTDAGPPLHYPGKTWDEKDPGEAGLDSARLDSYKGSVLGRGCVTRGGYMVYTWGDQAARGDVASACKPFFSHFLFTAVEEGLLENIDVPARQFEPRLDAINKDLGYKDRGILFRHFATQTSCYGVTESPGTAFDYNDFQMALFFDTLFLKVYGKTYDNLDADVFRARLCDVIECEDSPTFFAFGKNDRPGRTAISVRDFARFGLLYMRGGRWNDRELIPADVVLAATTSPLPNAIPRTNGVEAEMIAGQRSLGSNTIPDNQTDHYGSYSYLWWTNGVDRDGNRQWPDAPLDTYGAFGHGGKRAMVVIPSLDIVTSWNDSGIDTPEKANEALKRLVASVQ